MADQTSPIQQIAAGSNAVDRVNENFDAASPALLWGRDARSTAGLTWGYVGGRWGGAAIPNGTVTLVASATNYVVASLATGAVLASTSRAAWDNSDDFLRLYLVTTGPATTVEYEDHRQAFGGNGGGGSGPALAPVISISAASHEVDAGETGAYLRFTATGDKTCTFRPESAQALPANGEWHLRNAAAGNLALSPGAGVTLNPPYSGTLVVPPGGTVTVKRVAADLFDVLGVTA